MPEFASVSSVGQLLQNMQDQAAVTRNRDADTQLLNIKTLLGGQELQMRAQNQVAQDQYRGLLQQMMINPIGQNVPGLPSVAQDQEAQFRKDPNQAIMQDLNARQTRADQMRMLAASTPGIDPAPWIRETEAIAEARRKVAADISNQKQDNFKQISNLVATIDSPQMASAALQQIADSYGAEPALAIDRRLQHDPQSGAILWNPANKQVFAAIGQQFTTQNQQAKQAQDKQDWQLNVDKQIEEARHHVRTEQEGDARVAIAQGGLTERRLSREQRYELAGVGTEVKVTQQDQTRINKIGDTAKLMDYNKANGVAAAMESRLLDPKRGYEEVTPANARSLLTQAQLMVSNFRPRAGSKYESEQFGRMNGLMDRIAKYTESIGTGDKLLAKDRMLELSREMRNLYADRNADVLREEMNVAQATNKKGGNATLLVMQGKLEDAIAAGRASRNTVNGQEYVTFIRPGIKPTRDDVFPVPSAPERKNIFFGGDSGSE